MEVIPKVKSTDTLFVPDKHDNYLLNLDSTKGQYAIGFFTNEHLKLPVAYWCILL